MEYPIGMLEFMAGTDAYNAGTTGRPIEKAMRAVTVKAHFSHDGKGTLHPVKAHVRWVQQVEFEIIEARRVAQTHEAILKLRDGNRRPPYITTMHMRLGAIGLTYDRLWHIIDQRKKAGQDVDACIKGIAECIVRGGLKAEPTGTSGDTGPVKGETPAKKKREHPPQIWATHGKHQVTLNPFWDDPSLPTDKVATWIVSGYEMTDDRPEKTAEAKDIQIEITNPETK